MKIHNVPVIGKLNENFATTLRKLELCTPKHLWNGIRCIYVRNSSIKEDLNTTGVYVSGTIDKGGTIKIFLDKRTITITENKDLPFIYINTYRLIDEWNLAFTLLHELGHNHEKTQELKEYNAHKFSLKYVKPYVFKRNKIIDYYSEIPIDWNNI